MKEKTRNVIRLILLWTGGALGRGIIFPFLKVFSRFKRLGHEKRKFISASEVSEVIVIYNHPFRWTPVIFPSLLSIVNKRSYNGKFWFFPLIERNEERGWKGIMRFIRRVKESKIIIFASEGNGKNGEVSKMRKFQSGISILSKEIQVTTLPIWTEGKEDVIFDKSLLGDYLFFFSIFSTWKQNAAP